MGRRSRGGFSRTINLIAPYVSKSRKIKLDLLERVEPLLKGNVITTPLWYDAMKAHPPLPKTGWTKKPRMLEFPEDRLKRVWLRRNPWATMHVKTLFHEEQGLSTSEREHPADAFVKRQMELMRKGLDEEDAYRQALKQQEQETVASPEAADALRAARAFGATPGGDATGETGEAAASSSGSGSGLVKQALLRQFAEEAREAKLPYPAHWFDKDGNWTGIPTAASTPAGRRRSAATDELELELSKIDLGDPGTRGRPQ